MIHLIDLLLAAYITWNACITVGRMSPSTPHGIGFSYILLAISSFAVFFGILMGHLNPDWPRVAFEFGVSLYILFDKREKHANVGERSKPPETV